MFDMSWQDHRMNERVSCKTKVRDIMHVIKARKFGRLHIARLQDNIWTPQVMEQRPIDTSRP